MNVLEATCTGTLYDVMYVYDVRCHQIKEQEKEKEMKEALKIETQSKIKTAPGSLAKVRIASSSIDANTDDATAPTEGAQGMSDEEFFINEFVEDTLVNELVKDRSHSTITSDDLVSPPEVSNAAADNPRSPEQKSAMKMAQQRLPPAANDKTPQSEQVMESDSSSTCVTSPPPFNSPIRSIIKADGSLQSPPSGVKAVSFSIDDPESVKEVDVSLSPRRKVRSR